MTTVFISGHTDVGIKEFTRYYLPLLQHAVKKGWNFVVGDADGVDALSQIFLKKAIPEENQSRVKVFYKGSEPQNYMSTGFLSVGGFVSHKEAAVAMTLCSDEDIAYVHNGRYTSVTAENILRRFTKDFPFTEYINAEPRNYEFWEMITSIKKQEEGE